MQWLQSNMVAMCYSFLFLSVLLLWLPSKHKFTYWSMSLLLAMGLGLASHTIYPVALLPIGMLWLSSYDSPTGNLLIRMMTGLLVLSLCVCLSLHLFPGFNNYLALNHIKLTPDAAPYSMYLNFDKALVGIFILAFGHHLISTYSAWKKLFKQFLPQAVIVITVVLALACAVNFIHFAPKFPDYFYIWALTNLLFVCVAEEALFRGFIQKHLALALQKIRYGDYIALMIASIVFGLAHYTGGITYVFLATVLGLGLGWIYMKTKHIEASILTHFGLNVTHFLLFTYPALMTMS